MAYTPPSGNAVNFDLQTYTVPSGSAVNFELNPVSSGFFWFFLNM